MQPCPLRLTEFRPAPLANVFGFIVLANIPWRSSSTVSGPSRGAPLRKWRGCLVSQQAQTYSRGILAAAACRTQQKRAPGCPGDKLGWRYSKQQGPLPSKIPG